MTIQNLPNKIFKIGKKKVEFGVFLSWECFELENETKMTKKL